MTRGIPFAVALLVYALAVLVAGGLTWFVALPGASALTAILVSGGAAALAVVFAVLTLRMKSARTPALIGIYAGIVLPLLVAVGAGMRLRGSLEKANAFNAAVRQGAVAVDFESIRGKTHPTPAAYQTVGLGAIVAISAQAFVTLILLRPRQLAATPIRVESVSVNSAPPPIAAAPVPPRPPSLE